MKKVVLLLLLAGCEGGKPSAQTGRISLDGDLQEFKDGFENDPIRWKGAVGTWDCRSTDGGRVLAQTSTGNVFNVCLLQGYSFSDVDISVRFRPVSGKEDASGGIVLRARDERNYYVVRANALEDNFRLYKTVDGARHPLASTGIQAPALGQWHTIRIVARKDRLQAYLNGELLIDHRDGAFTQGSVGLWTKADSVTEFDDFFVRGAKP